MFLSHRYSLSLPLSLKSTTTAKKCPWVRINNIPVESGKKKKTPILYKKTTTGLEVINNSFPAATALTSHLPSLSLLKTLAILPSSFAENKSWELPFCSNPVLLGLKDS